MKNKVIIGMILTVFILLITSSICQVSAYTGEIDPKNYVSLPSIIWVNNKIGTGTITLSSNAKDYKVSYQKLDVTAQKLQEINAKVKAYNDYVKTSNETIETKSASVKSLAETYKELRTSNPSDEEAIAEAKNNYDVAYKEYNQYLEDVKAELANLQKAYIEEIPTYTNSWTELTDGSNKVELDFTDYSGTANFLLWVKITNGTETYYDVNGYSTEIKDSATPSEGEEPEGETPAPGTTEGNDFANANYELKKDGYTFANLEITGATLKEGSRYYIVVSNNGNKPNIKENASLNDITIPLISLEKDANTLKTTGSELAEYVELNQDLYISIVERTTDNVYNVVYYGKKLTRFAEPKYTDAFFATFMSDSTTQLVTNFTHNSKNNRKLQIKVGKITDNTILQKIKNQDSSGFANLLSYAKSNQGLLNQTVDVSNTANSIEYLSYSAPNNTVLKVNGLVDKAYYYLYVSADDENGKYITQEAVTLAQASIISGSDGWSMHFYGSGDFEWAEFGGEGQGTEMPGELPNAGVKATVITIIALVIIIGTISFKKYKKYDV